MRTKEVIMQELEVAVARVIRERDLFDKTESALHEEIRAIDRARFGAKDTTGLVVCVGDKIEIRARGTIVKGLVHSANYYKGDGGWYIEVSPTVDDGYSYWKQRDDRGYIDKLNEVEVECSTTKEAIRHE